MKRLNNFTMIFDSVMLNILIAFFLFYIFCPAIIFGKDIQGNTIPYENLWLAGALVVLLVKYLHENATTTERFEAIYKWLDDREANHSWKIFFLYASKLLVPLTVSLCIFLCLWLPDKSSLLIRWFENISDKGKIICLFSITFSYLISFLTPDIVHAIFVYAYKNTGSNKGSKRLYSEKLLSKTCNRWLAVSIPFFIITLVGLFICYSKSDIKLEHCKLVLSGFIVTQTVADYIINREFYFKVGH